MSSGTLIDDLPSCLPAWGAFFTKIARGVGDPEMSKRTHPAKGRVGRNSSERATIAN